MKLKGEGGRETEELTELRPEMTEQEKTVAVLTSMQVYIVMK